MSNRILLSKLLFCHKLSQLEESSLGNEFYRTQKNQPNKFFGVVAECQKYLNEWNIQSIENYTKIQFKRLIKAKIYEKQRFECLEAMKGYKKIDYESCVNEEFEMKHYFKTLNITESRLYYKIKYYLVPTVPLNFKNDPKFWAQKYLCQDCLEVSKQDHSETQKGVLLLLLLNTCMHI